MVPVIIPSSLIYRAYPLKKALPNFKIQLPLRCAAASGVSDTSRRDAFTGLLPFSSCLPKDSSLVVS